MILMAVVVSMTTSSCSSIDPYTSSRPIRVKVSTEATKSSPITDDNLSSFQIIAVADDKWHDNRDGSQYEAGVYFKATANKDGSNWNLGEHLWLNNVNLHLWCFSPVLDDSDPYSAEGGRLSITPPSAGSDVLLFSYRLPNHVDGSDATNQKDIVFAGNSEKRVFKGDGSFDSQNCTGSGSDENVDITFYHPLSEIQFAVSPDDGTFDTGGLKIVDIAISNIAGSGECSFSLPKTFEWTLGERNKTYNQTVDATFDTKPDGWKESEFGDDKTLYTFSNSFFMIPQELTDAVLSVTFERRGDESRVTKDVNLFDKGDNIWAPGKYYKYKISATHLGLVDINLRVTLSIHDWMSKSKETILE